MSLDHPILVTGAAGRVGGVGGAVVELLRRRHLPVRALVRRDDARAEALRALGAEVVVGDLTRRGCRASVGGVPPPVLRHECVRTLPGGDGHCCRRGARARRSGGVRQHLSDDRVADEPDRDDGLAPAAAALAGEQVLNWSGLPVVHVRATVFLQHFFFLAWAAESIARDATIRLPFATGHTSPVDVRDVAEVIAAILAQPAAHIGKVYELTGPRSQDLHALAAEYAAALGAPSGMWMCPWSNGGTRSCAAASCRSMSSSTC